MRRLGRRLLDRRLGIWRELPAAATALPAGGWVRAIRDALGMTAADLGLRMGISAGAVRRLEARERQGTARLESLHRAADAMGCDLVYSLVPRVPLDQTVHDRARAMAARELAQVGVTMRLEGHDVDAAAAADLLDLLTDRMLDDRDLWSIQDE